MRWKNLVISRATSNDTILMKEGVMMVVNNQICQREVNFEKMICRIENERRGKIDLKTKKIILPKNKWIE